MAASQMSGRFKCYCCSRPFARKGDLVRHLTCLQRKGEHDEYYSEPRHADELQNSFGLSWAAIRDMPHGSRECPSVALVSSGDTSHQPRAFFGPQGRSRLADVVDRILREVSSVNDFIEEFDESGLGLTSDEVELASLVCMAAARSTARLSHRYVKLQREDTDLPGASVERRQLRHNLRQLRRGFKDLSSTTAHHAPTSSQKMVHGTSEKYSDVEPDSDGDTRATVTPVDSSSPPPLPEDPDEVIVISDIEQDEHPTLGYQMAGYVVEDITPVASP